MNTVPKYPLPAEPEGARFDDSFVDVVAEFVGYRHFPYPVGPDFERLREALRGFLFGHAEAESERTTAVAEAKPDTLGVPMTGRGAGVSDETPGVECLPGCYDPTLDVDHVAGCPVGEDSSPELPDCSDECAAQLLVAVEPQHLATCPRLVAMLAMMGRVTGVPLCEHGDDAEACQLRHAPTTRELITQACAFDALDVCSTHGAVHLNTAMCLGAPAGFVADCGLPGPHGPHEVTR